MEKDVKELIGIAKEALYLAYNWAPDCNEDGDGYVEEAQKNLKRIDNKLAAISKKYA